MAIIGSKASEHSQGAWVWSGRGAHVRGSCTSRSANRLASRFAKRGQTFTGECGCKNLSSPTMVNFKPLIAAVCASTSTIVAVSAKDAPINWNNVTGTASETFPTDVGALGDTVPGGAPFVAQRDKLNTTRPFGPYGIEMRWLPKDVGHENTTSNDIFSNLGPYTPWRPSTLFPQTAAYEVLPDQCTVKQVHILHRHGARYPTDGMDDGPGLLAAKIQNTTRNNTFEASGELAFLHDWKYELGVADLVHQGAQELFDSGVKAYYQYGKLLENATEKPVIRASSSSRVVDSARYWALGFFGWDATSKVNLEVLTEADKQNNTLEPKHSCPNGDEIKFGDKMRKQWQNVYLQKPLDRIQQHIKGINLTIDDMENFISMCPYETSGMGYSQFCNLFTKEEWESYEYEADLKFQANNGFMSPTGKAMGIGYVNEFLERVTHGNYSQPQTTQNNTLDKNPTYFPVNQTLYADFSHDSVMVSILTAFNFTQFSTPLGSGSIVTKRGFRASDVVPFGARVVFEVLECTENKQPTNYIRVKINEAVLPLDEGQGCAKRPDGLCKLDDFVGFLKAHANDAAKFELACYGKNGTDFTVTGPVSTGTLEDSQMHK